MYSTRLVKCKKCGIEQELNSDEFKECPNGCYKIKLDRSGYSYSYKTDNGKENCIDEYFGEIKTYYQENDVLEPDEELNKLMNIIEGYKEKLGCLAYYCRDFKRDASGKDFLERFYFSYEGYDSNRQNTEFELWISFIDEYRFSNKEESLSKVKKRMVRFIDILEKLYKKEFEITDRKYIYENIDYLDCESKNKDLTDDIYYF